MCFCFVRLAAGYLVTDRKEIRRIYMRSWFWIDALACFPSSEVEAAVDTFPKGLRALRLVKMLRLLRLQRVMSRHLEAAGAYLHHIKIATQISLWFFIAHLLGCAWYFAGHQVESGYSGQKIYGWVHHEDWPVLRLFPHCALISHAQGSSGVVDNMLFAWRGHTKRLTTRARPSPDLAVWLE